MIQFRAELIVKSLRLDKEKTFGLMESMGVDVVHWKIKPEGPVGVKKREIVLQAAVNYLESIGVYDQTKLLVDIFKRVDQFSMNHFDEIIKPIKGVYTLI